MFWKNKCQKGLFLISEVVSEFHIGLMLCVEKWNAEAYLLIAVGKYNISIGYRWRNIDEN